MDQIKWWAIESEEAIKLLNSDVRGLNEEERRKRLEKYGLNEIRGREKTPLEIFIKQFKNPIMLVLIVSTFAFIFLNFIAEAVVVFIIVIISALVGFLLG